MRVLVLLIDFHLFVIFVFHFVTHFLFILLFLFFIVSNNASSSYPRVGRIASGEAEKGEVTALDSPIGHVDVIIIETDPINHIALTAVSSCSSSGMPGVKGGVSIAIKGK